MVTIPFRASARRLPMLFVLVAICGCAVTSTNPVTPLEGSDPIPDYLLGTWDYVELASLSAEGKEGELDLTRSSDGTLDFVLREQSGTVAGRASFAIVGDLQIVSMPPEGGQGNWAIAALSFDATAQKLTLAFLSHREVVEDIKQGSVQGEVFFFDDQELAHLTASSVQLRAYFVEHGDVFTDRIAVFRKSEP